MSKDDIFKNIDIKPWNGELTESHRPFFFKEDIDTLDKEYDDIRFIADNWGSMIDFKRLKIVKETPKGYWFEVFGSKFWRPKNSKKACKTKREALHHLFHRRRSYMGHSKRRYDESVKMFNRVKFVIESLKDGK
jgi:hypothetical protein